MGDYKVLSPPELTQEKLWDLNFPQSFPSENYLSIMSNKLFTMMLNG
jgi:hypothetical protein